jgi:type IV pilus assembly protein PilN
VSEFLRNLQNNTKYVERPELIEIKLAAQSPQNIQRRLFEFSLNFYMRPTGEAPVPAAGRPAQPAPGAKA